MKLWLFLQIVVIFSIADLVFGHWGCQGYCGVYGQTGEYTLMRETDQNGVDYANTLARYCNCDPQCSMSIHKDCCSDFRYVCGAVMKRDHDICHCDEASHHFNDRCDTCDETTAYDYSGKTGHSIACSCDMNICGGGGGGSSPKPKCCSHCPGYWVFQAGPSCQCSSACGDTIAKRFTNERSAHLSLPCCSADPDTAGLCLEDLTDYKYSPRRNYTDKKKKICRYPTGSP